MVINIDDFVKLVESRDTQSVYAQLNHINSLDLSNKFKALLLILDNVSSTHFLKEYMALTNSFRKEFEAIKQVNRKLSGGTSYPNDDEFVRELLLEYRENNYPIF
jgi:hypothetical protein